MKLPIPFLQGKDEKSLHYLALILTSEKASAVILEEVAGKIKIVSRQQHFFSQDIETLPLDELVDAIDKAVGHAEETLPPDVEIRKTVFGVKQHWVEEDTKKIKKHYLQKLKKVCDALALSPIGFMVVSEAISNLMQQEEGAPLSAILAELGRKTATLTLLRGGKILHTIEGKLEGNKVATVDELLKRFTVEVLPARIILYDFDTDERLIQQFISHKWSKSLPFLHMPQISVLGTDFDSRAVAFGAATQMGFDVLGDMGAIQTFETGVPGAGHPAGGHDSNAAIAAASALSHATQSTSHIHHEDEEAEDVEDEKENASSTQLIPEESFGFVQNTDIAEAGAAAITAKPESSHQHHHHYKSGDIVSDSLVLPQETGKPLHAATDEVDGEDITDDDDEEEETSAEKTGFFSRIKSSGISMPSIALPSSWLLWILLPVVFLALLIGGVYYFYTNKMTAAVILSLTPKKVTKDSDVVFSSDGTNDFSNNILAAKKVEGSIDGDLTIGATGKKQVGDKAHGTVTLYNNSTDGDTTVTQGTTIKSENGLNFTIDKDVDVASASGDKFSGTKPGTADVNVTASDIGTNYNLPSGTKFSVAGSNEIVAKNDNAFSGGTSKSITIVSKDDLAKLRTELVKSLQDKAGQTLAKQTEADGAVLPVVLSTSVDKATYDKNAGDESKTVKLTASVSFAGLSYKQSDAKSFAKSVLANGEGKDMNFSDDAITVNVHDAAKKGDTDVAATLTIEASLLPDINTSGLAQKLSGKSQKDANFTLSQLPQVNHTSITFRPNIPFLPTLFPNLPKHVTVTTTSD